MIGRICGTGSYVPDHFLDIYTPMLSAGFVPEDGIHYANADANNYLLALMRFGIGN